MHPNCSAQVSFHQSQGPFSPALPHLLDPGANQIVCTTFLNSISVLIYDICFLLTYFALYDSLYVHIPTHVCIEYFLALYLHFIDTF